LLESSLGGEGNADSRGGGAHAGWGLLTLEFGEGNTDARVGGADVWWGVVIASGNADTGVWGRDTDVRRGSAHVGWGLLKEF